MTGLRLCTGLRLFWLRGHDVDVDLKFLEFLIYKTEGSGDY
jgi:hypothetical protein